ncbi:MAG: hypothetical protein ACOC7V_16130 [Spirochaetota bacterium]
MDVNGFLYSQVGYDIGDPMRAIIRGGSRSDVPEDATFEVVRLSGDDEDEAAALPAGPVRYWGSTWNAHWWEIDFSGIEDAGTYAIVVRADGKELLKSEPIEIARHLLWEKTVVPVALDGMEERQRRARNGIGWKDCGASWREANSHATMVIALCELVEVGFEWITPDNVTRIHAQILHGLAYLARLQDATDQTGAPDGAVIHEIPNHMDTIPGDTAKAVVAFTYASRVLADIHPDEASEYLDRATRAMDYLLLDAEPHTSDGFSHMTHGVEADFKVPHEFMTRDLVMMLYGCVELYVAGQVRYKQHALRLAREIMERQVPEEKAEGGTNGDPKLWGHFYTFASSDLTEKSSCHNGFGHDTGGTFPHFLVPFAAMCRWWRDHPDVPRWQATLRRFVNGYLVPACSANPFYLLPIGCFPGEGLLNFAGPWHGINTTFGFGAAMAAALEGYASDENRETMRQIVVGNLQWLCGLNAGITRKSFEGCLVWKEEIPEGEAVPYSQISGVGRRWVGNWTGIVGTIPNGFNVNPQFRFEVPASREADEPLLYTDEDWIPHAAGFIAGLVALRGKHRFE